MLQEASVPPSPSRCPPPPTASSICYRRHGQVLALSRWDRTALIRQIDTALAGEGYDRKFARAESTRGQIGAAKADLAELGRAIWEKQMELLGRGAEGEGDREVEGEEIPPNSEDEDDFAAEMERELAAAPPEVLRAEQEQRDLERMRQSLRSGAGGGGGEGGGEGGEKVAAAAEADEGEGTLWRFTGETQLVLRETKWEEDPKTGQFVCIQKDITKPSEIARFKTKQNAELQRNRMMMSSEAQAEHLERRRERHRLEEQKRRERIKFRKSTQRLQEFSEGKYGVGEAEEKAFKGFVCTACGEYGHKSTNRKCIYYEATMRENAKARDQASAQGLIQPKDASGLKLTVKTGEVEKRREKATVSLNLKNTLAHKRKQEAEAYTSNLTKIASKKALPDRTERIVGAPDVKFNKVIEDIVAACRAVPVFFPFVGAAAEVARDYLKVIERPMDLNAMRQKPALPVESNLHYL
ncbi:MAG: hypothetical protein SGPRY_009459 [Prymnesium sp.]